MSRIRGRDTGPERRLNDLLRRLGYRPKEHRRELPGTPDLVLPKRKIAIFVHGCFWHRHAGCSLAYTPKSNRSFWRKKFEATVVRDRSVRALLRRMGWQSLVIWECQLARLERLPSQLRRKVTARY